MRLKWCLLVVAPVFVGGAVLMGCGAGLTTFTGGGLPPGEPDIGGVVLAAAASASATTRQADIPVEGAEVLLHMGSHVVGRAITGPGGFFRFENPDTGSYVVSVTPPPGSGLRPAQRAFTHHHGQQTFLTIVLERE